MRFELHLICDREPTGKLRAKSQKKLLSNLQRDSIPPKSATFPSGN